MTLVRGCHFPSLLIGYYIYQSDKMEPRETFASKCIYNFNRMGSTFDPKHVFLTIFEMNVWVKDFLGLLILVILAYINDVCVSN